MLGSRKFISLLLALSALLLTACAVISIRSEGQGDPELTAHPLCGISGGHHCEGFDRVLFRIYVNSEIFYPIQEPTQNYLAEVMPSRIRELLGEEASFDMVSLPFSIRGSNYCDNEILVRIMFSTYPEDMLPPMVSLLMSSENVLVTDHAMCSGEPGSASFCLEDLQTLLQGYFTSKDQ